MMAPRAVTDWFWIPQPRPGATIRLFCFPHAGGDAPSFTHLGRTLPDDIEVWAVRMPGRGGRFSAPHAADLDELVDWLVTALRPHLSGRFALLGQSLGALVAYNVGRRLANSHPPSACVLAALLPPLQWQRPPGPDGSEDIVEFLRSIDDSVNDVLADPGLREIVLSAVRADLSLCDDYRHLTEPRLDCPLLALVGRDDPTVSPRQMAGWAEYTTGSFGLRVLPAGHLVLQGADTETASAVGEFLIHDADPYAADRTRHLTRL